MYTKNLTILHCNYRYALYNKMVPMYMYVIILETEN